MSRLQDERCPWFTVTLPPDSFSLCEAICRALGSQGEGVHPGAPVNCLLPTPLRECSLTGSFSPCNQKPESGEPGHVMA